MPKQRRARNLAATSAVATRLRTYGLSTSKVSLSNDLEVPANQTVTLDAADRKFSTQVSKLTPKSIDDLKTWIGVPDAAFAHTATAVVAQPRTILPVHETYTAEQHKDLYALARNYLFGHSASVNRAQIPALNQWISSIAGSISVILFRDIHVASGATLLVSPSITVLFARYITIDSNGAIRVGCTYGGINCAGIKGQAYREPWLPLNSRVVRVHQ